MTHLVCLLDENHSGEFIDLKGTKKIIVESGFFTEKQQIKFKIKSTPK